MSADSVELNSGPELESEQAQSTDSARNEPKARE